MILTSRLRQVAMRTYSFVLLVALLLLLIAPTTLYAQNPVPLWKLSSGEFGRIRDTSLAVGRTDLNNSLFIRLLYSSFGQDDAVLVVTFSNQDGTFRQSYPVEIFSYKDKNKKVEIYGPQYYEGQDQLSVSFDLVLLKKDTMLRYKDKFDTFFKPAATFIPIIAQASGYIEKAWDAMKGVMPDTKTESLGAVPIIRMTDLDLPSTENRWFLLGNADALASAAALQRFPAASTDSLQPTLPVEFSKGKNRLLLVSITKGSIPPSFSDLAKRQSELLGDTKKQRIGKLGIKIINPYDSNRTQEELAMSRIFSGFLALTELANVRKGLKTDFAVTWVFDEFKQGQAQGSDSGSIIKLSPDNEARVSHAFASFFDYEGLPNSSNEKGLPSIAAWDEWLDKRKGAGSIEWYPAEADATHPNVKVGVAPYGKATTKYVRGFINQNLPTANPNAQLDMKTRIQSMGKDIARLRNLLSVFRPTETEPWLFYEQQYTAQWIRDHLEGISDLPTQPLKSDQDVKLFGDAFEKQLTTSKVLQREGNKWRFVPVGSYVADAFTAALPTVPTSTNPNKQEALRKIYLLLIDPVTADPEITSAKDLADLSLFLNRTFPPDMLSKKNFTEMGFNDYFRNNVLKVENLGTRSVINVPQRSGEVLSKMKYAEGLFSSDIKPAFDTPGSINELKTRRLEALRQLAQVLNNNLVDLSIRQKTLAFLRNYVPSIIDAAASPVQDTAYINLWSAKLMGSEGLITKSKLTWSDDVPGFVEMGSADDLSEITSIRSLYDAIKDTPAVEPTGGKDVTVERLIKIACTISNSVAQRDAAFKLLQLMVELPQSVDQGSCQSYELFRSQGYSWVNGKYRLNPIASVPASPSPTP